MTRTRYTAREEFANSLTHGLGLAASVAGTIILVALAAVRGDVWQIVGASVYSVTLISLYTASTLYHAVREPRAKRLMRVLDHCAIYLLIAGTYTPFALVSLRGEWGWTILAVVWSLCAVGTGFKIFFTGRLNALSTIVYVLMGWLCVIVAKPMAEALNGGEIPWLITGGVAYTAGIFFYHNRRVPYSHAVWHLFVVAGSACHYLAISHQVLVPVAQGSL